MAHSIYFMAFLVLAMMLFVAYGGWKLNKLAKQKAKNSKDYVLPNHHVEKLVLRRSLQMVIVANSKEGVYALSHVYLRIIQMKMKQIWLGKQKL
ncbi:hypothetical protein P3S67_029777 [Capsicum chacoense]